MKYKILSLIHGVSAKKAAVFFFCVGLILSFFQINAILLQDVAWSGQFSPYATFQLYLSDIIFLFALLSYGCYIFGNAERVFISIGNIYTKLAISIAAFFVLASYFFSSNEMITFFWLIQFFKLLVVYIFVINRLVSEKHLIYILLGCLGFQLILGLTQFVIQSNIGLGFLGESKIGPDVLNVAKIDVAGAKVIRPYGTFTHANIFGGLMSLGFLLSGYLYMQESISSKKAYFLLGVFALGVVLSFSRSAWLAMMVSIVLFMAFRKFKITYGKIRNFTISFLAFAFIGYLSGVLNLILVRLQFVKDTSLLERTEQIKTSFAMMFSHPFGVGLGNYTTSAASFSPGKLMPWEFEPVHNTFLLVGTELGILALILAVAAIIFTLIKLFKLLPLTEGKYKCFPIYFAIILITHLTILLNLDHYFYTNYSSGVFLMVTLGIMTNYLANLEESGVRLG